MKQGLLITGSSGFVGTYAKKDFENKYDVHTVSLRSNFTDELFEGIDAVLHLAGKAHQMGKTDSQEYFTINRDLAFSFAEKAKRNKVRQFIYISSTKVYGDNVTTVLDEYSECHPTDPYGESKFLAEQDLLKLEDSDFTVSIIRPPLIYGFGVKGNLDRITSLIEKLPIIPFGGIQNKRSMVYLGNLTALIDKIIKSNASGIFIAGDDDSYSTTQLVDSILKHRGLRKKNVALPGFLIQLIKFIKPSIHNRLFGSYQVDNKSTNKRLDFKPPFSFDQGIKKMIEKI